MNTYCRGRCSGKVTASPTYHSSQANTIPSINEIYIQPRQQMKISNYSFIFQIFQ